MQAAGMRFAHQTSRIFQRQRCSWLYALSYERFVSTFDSAVRLGNSLHNGCRLYGSDGQVELRESNNFLQVNGLFSTWSRSLQKVGFADAIRARGMLCDSNKWHYVFEQVSTEQDGFLSLTTPLGPCHL